MGGFDSGFNNGFDILGVNNMATMNYPINGTILTATALTSGTCNISGLRDDENSTILFSPLGATGVAYIKAGDYQNSEDGASVNVYAGSGMYAWHDIDGAKYRQDDGTLEFYVTTSGTLYSFTRKVV